MADESKDPEPPKSKDLDPKQGEETECTGKTGETSSSGTSEGKSESSSRVTQSEDESQQTSVAASVSVSKESESASRSAEPPVSKESKAFAKWDSPEQKQTAKESSRAADSKLLKKSPNKQEQRPATVGKGGGKETKSIGDRFKDWVKTLGKSSKEVLLEPEDASVSGEGTSCQVGEETQPEVANFPKYAHITGQEGVFLHGRMMTDKESSEENITDTTSLSVSISLGDKMECSQYSEPGSRVDSLEGSTGDASDLEKDELSSPSKSVQQGQKRTKNPEDEAAKGFSESSSKRILQDTDHAEGISEDSEMTDVDRTDEKPNDSGMTDEDRRNEKPNDSEMTDAYSKDEESKESEINN